MRLKIRHLFNNTRFIDNRKINSLVLYAFLLIFIDSASLNTFANTNNCSDFFNKASLAHSDLLQFTDSELLSPSYDGNPQHEHKSVHIVDYKTTSEGELIRLRRDGLFWESHYRSTSFTPDGNPLNFAIIVGAKIANFFGFHKIVDSIDLYAPTAKRVNYAINKINAFFSKTSFQKIKFNFYDELKQAEIPLIDLLRKFVKNYSFPLLSRGDLTVHDLAFHITGLLIPNRVLEHARLQSELILKFHDFTKTRLSLKTMNKNLAEEINIFLNRLIYFRVADTDIGTGNVTSFMKVHKLKLTQDGYDPQQAIKNTFDTLTGNSLSPLEYLWVKMNLSYSKQKDMGMGDLFTHNISNESRNEILITLKDFLEKQNTNINEFLHTVSSDKYRARLVDENGNTYTPEKYLNDIVERIKQIEKVLP